MPITQAQTDDLQRMADSFGTYVNAVAAHVDQLLAAWQDLPAHWQGSAAQQAYYDIEALIGCARASCRLADELRAGLIEARQFFEQAGMNGLKNVSLGSQESKWVPRAYAGGDQGALTGGQITVEDVLSNVSRFATNQGPLPLGSGQSSLDAASQVSGAVNQLFK